jgi:hypothetical protein
VLEKQSVELKEGLLLFSDGVAEATNRLQALV